MGHLLCDLFKAAGFRRDRGRKRRNRFLKDLAQKEVLFPDGRTRQPSVATLRRKFKPLPARRILMRFFRTLARTGANPAIPVRSVMQ